MFDPQLTGYWGTKEIESAMDVCLGIISEYSSKVDGIKISLLDAEKEIELRRKLPYNVKMLTGDDFNYDRLILGDETGFSHALLGIFDGIAPAASAALKALDENNADKFAEILEPTIPLSRLIFAAPTFSYKTGIIFLAYLNGHQTHFKMVGGKESARSVLHMSELFRLADMAKVLIDPELAVQRMKSYLALAGVDNG